MSIENGQLGSISDKVYAKLIFCNDSCGAMQMVIKSLSLITTLESVSEVTWLMGCNLLYTVKMTRKYANYFQYKYIIGMFF